MKSTLMFSELTPEEAQKISAFAASLGTTASVKKLKKVEEPDPEDEETDEEEESPKSKKASKSGSKAGAKSSTSSKKKPVEEEEDEDDESDDEDEESDDDEDEAPKSKKPSGKANLEGIKELAKALADKGKEAVTKKILLEFGAKVVSKLDPADYIPVYTRLAKLNEKSK